jgi:hypothetical protein
MKSLIDMSRPNALYAIGVGLLMVVSLVLSNIPQTNLSLYYVVPFKREIAAALFGVGTLFGLLAMLRHLRRVRMPWKVPQSQVFTSFAVFFLMTLTALIIAK